jgi:uncharacterized BrkB/YihY/UPF0761 family membrane protein
MAMAGDRECERANVVTAGIRGTAGGIIVLPLWVYYPAQIFLLGEELVGNFAPP